MNLCHRLRRMPDMFCQLTGLTVAAFDQLRDELVLILAAQQAEAR